MVAVRAVDNLTEEIGTVTDGRVTEAGNTLSVSRDRKTLTQTHEGRHARRPSLYERRRLRQTVRVGRPSEPRVAIRNFIDWLTGSQPPAPGAIPLRTGSRRASGTTRSRASSARAAWASCMRRATSAWGARSP